MARDLVAGKLLAAMLDERLARQARVLLHHHDLRHLAGLLVGHADRPHLQHARMERHHVLDLVRIDVEAGDDDHVLLAIDDAKISLLVHGRHVAGAKPPVVREDLGGSVRPAPVALHDLRAPHAELSRRVEPHLVAVIVADGDVGRRERQPDRSGELGLVQAVRDRGGRGLGEPVGLDHGNPGHLAPAVRNRALHGHPAPDRELEAGEVDRREGRRVEQAVVEGVDPRDDGELEPGDELDEGGHVAGVGDEHVQGAVLHAGEAVRDQREDVVERERGHEDLLSRLEAPADPRRGLLQVRDHVAVAQGRPLGDPGRPPGVLEERDVVPAGLGRTKRLPPPLLERAREPYRVGKVERGHHLLHPADHEVDERGLREPEPVAHPHEDHVLDPGAADDVGEHAREVLDDDDGPRLRVGELVLELARGVEGVRVDHREAGEQHPEDRDRVREEVRHHDRDPVARLEPEPLEVPGKGPRAFVELAVGDRDPEVRVGGTVAEPANALLEQRDDGVVGVDVRLGGDALRIVPEPDLVHPPLPCGSGQHRH